MLVRKFFKDNGLSIVLLLLFAVFLGGQSWAGFRFHNNERLERGEPAIGYRDYIAGPHFLEAMFENWESEFLQMGLFVILTALLVQKGSAESHKPEDGRKKDRSRKAQRGRVPRFLYEHSLSLSLLLLFAVSFVGHAVAGCRDFSEEEVARGGEAIGVLSYVRTSRFWFESFQNWQSEFLSIGVLVILTIFLREKGSSQSKALHAPHGQTGPE
jgi:hypothetical protein